MTNKNKDKRGLSSPENRKSPPKSRKVDFSKLSTEVIKKCAEEASMITDDHNANPDPSSSFMENFSTEMNKLSSLEGADPNVMNIIKILIPAITITVQATVSNALSASKLQSEQNTKTVLNKLQSHSLLHHYELDRLEQYTRRENIRISNVADFPGEDLTTTVCKIANEIGVDLQRSDISACHRVSAKNQQVICRFVSREKKFEIFAKKKALKSKPDSPFRDIFISEDLTPLRAKLRWMAKDLPDVKSAYSRNGVIHCIMANDGDRVVQINTPDDLFKLGVSDIDYKALGLERFTTVPTE